MTDETIKNTRPVGGGAAAIPNGLKVTREVAFGTYETTPSAPVDSPGDGDADEYARQIDNFYEEATNNRCTCGSSCEYEAASCSYCNAWEGARQQTQALLRQALATRPPAPADVAAVIADLRAKAKQRPSDGLIARQKLSERDIDMMQVGIATSADHLERTLCAAPAVAAEVERLTQQGYRLTQKLAKMQLRAQGGGA